MGLLTDGGTLAARNTSLMPFCVNDSLRLAVDVVAPGNPASTYAFAGFDSGRSMALRMRVSSPLALRVVKRTTHTPPHASIGLPALSRMPLVTTTRNDVSSGRN